MSVEQRVSYISTTQHEDARHVTVRRSGWWCVRIISSFVGQDKAERVGTTCFFKFRPLLRALLVTYPGDLGLTHQSNS